MINVETHYSSAAKLRSRQFHVQDIRINVGYQNTFLNESFCMVFVYSEKVEGPACNVTKSMKVDKDVREASRKSHNLICGSGFEANSPEGNFALLACGA